MSYSMEDLFGDFSDNDGFSEDEGMSHKGKQLFKKLSAVQSKLKPITSNTNLNANKKSAKGKS